MKVAIVAALLTVISFCEAEESKDKRQILAAGYPGYLGYGGLGYGLGYGGYGGYGLGYPGVYGGGLLLGRKRRDAEEESKDKRQIFAAGYPGYLGYGGLGYGLGYGGYGVGYPGVYGGGLLLGRKRREAEVNAEEGIKEKRQILAAGYPGYLGYGGLGYGLGYGGYGGYGIGYPGVVGGGLLLGRKRRDAEEESKDKRQIFAAGYPGYLGYGGLGYGLGYGGYGGYGYPGFLGGGVVLGRKRRDAEAVENTETTNWMNPNTNNIDKRQILAAGYPGYLGYGGFGGYGGYGLGYPGYLGGFGYPAGGVLLG